MADYIMILETRLEIHILSQKLGLKWETQGECGGDKKNKTEELNAHAKFKKKK